MPSVFVSNYSIDPDANHYSEIYPSHEGVNISQHYDSNSFKASLPRSSNKDFLFIHLNINFLGANGDKF